MVMLAALSLIIGALLGMRFKVQILVPASILVLAVVLSFESVCGYDFSRLVISAVLLTIGLQFGYLLGSFTANDLDRAIEQSHAAVAAILKGDPSVAEGLYSDRDDVTLGNPFDSYACGRKNVERTLAGAASAYGDGEITGVEVVAKYVSSDLACIVEVERGRSKVGGANEAAPLALRVTTLFRLEHRVWRLVHLHADQINDVKGV
jgi:hypothetical protein